MKIVTQEEREHTLLETLVEPAKYLSTVAVSMGTDRLGAVHFFKNPVVAYTKEPTEAKAMCKISGLGLCAFPDGEYLFAILWNGKAVELVFHDNGTSTAALFAQFDRSVVFDGMFATDESEDRVYHYQQRRQIAVALHLQVSDAPTPPEEKIDTEAKIDIKTGPNGFVIVQDSRREELDNGIVVLVDRNLTRTEWWTATEFDLARLFVSRETAQKALDKLEYNNPRIMKSSMASIIIEAQQLVLELDEDRHIMDLED